jgi:hypothetical protein
MTPAKKAKLSHVNARGAASMVNVGNKTPTERRAIAEGFITMSAAALKAVRANAIKKGDVLAVARIAGIQARAHRRAGRLPRHRRQENHSRDIDHRHGRSDRRGNGSAHGGGGGAAHRLRHGEERRQGDAHPRRTPAREDRRQERHLPSETVAKDASVSSALSWPALSS